MDLSKLNLPADVRPTMGATGIPWCRVACQRWSTCTTTRQNRGDICIPAIEAMAGAIPGFLACERCKGSGTVDRDCSLCGDSTFDHECNDGPAPCPRCRGTGKPQGTEGA